MLHSIHTWHAVDNVHKIQARNEKENTLPVRTRIDRKERDPRQKSLWNCYSPVVHHGCGVVCCFVSWNRCILCVCFFCAVVVCIPAQISHSIAIHCCMIYLFNWHFALGFYHVYRRFVYFFPTWKSKSWCPVKIEIFHIVFFSSYFFKEPQLISFRFPLIFRLIWLVDATIQWIEH